MSASPRIPDRDTLAGIVLALLAALIWSGNFIISRGVHEAIPPISLAFYRWLTASVIFFPFGFRKFRAERGVVMQHKAYFFWAALTGVTIFNTLVYIAGHSTTAINMALIGTTSSPLFVILFAYFFLDERVGPFKATGLILCTAGIVLLLSGGSWSRLLAFRFSTGDLWMLTAGFTFAIYSVLVRKKPPGISPSGLLFTVFTLGTLMLLPFYLYEVSVHAAVHWTIGLFLSVLFLGLGASVISFYCWNIAIAKLGAGRTSLFGNLIPVFATVEAIIMLGETFTAVHAVSMVVVIAGLVLANLKRLRREKRLS